ncbi:hypothetical protein RJ639_034270 [Escallonia herrerae]|uniref:Cytochrome P450 n=1 Tax=Escallonia herrerae TaxID=1293975 RepID=A0AA88WTN5_9ASTE|nr:hypothetical protein RJ639_034270 [Escallonia herrerae]
MEHLLILAQLLLVIIFICLLLHHFIYKKPQESAASNQTNGKLPLPPGRTGWPLIGETLDYLAKAGADLPENFVSNRVKRYSSRVFKTSLLGQPMAFLSGAEGNKFLFSNENKLVQVWWPRSIDKLFPSSHNNLRKMLSGVVKVDALRKLVGTTDVEMKQHLQKSWDRDEVNVSHVAKTYTFALACRLFLGIDDPREVQKIVKPIDDMSRGIFSIGVNLPGTAFRRAINASRAIHEDIERMIKQRKIDLSEKRATPTQDILSQMLLLTDEDGQFAKEADIASSLVGFLHGGYGTVTAALTFIMKYLAEHPDVYDEVLKVYIAQGVHCSVPLIIQDRKLALL